MIKELKFKTLSAFNGRNGTGKCSGIEIMSLDYENKILLSPITSKGATANCYISLPVEELNNFIKELQEFVP